jgi:hypothetical protein
VSACRKLLEQALYLLLDRALPDGRNRPAGGFEGGVASAVTGEVSVELGIPERNVGGRSAAARTVMTMPEAAMDKHGDAVAGEHDIGRAWEVSAMQAIPVARGEERRANGALGTGIFAADRSHHLGSDAGGNCVCHAKRRGLTGVPVGSRATNFSACQHEVIAGCVRVGNVVCVEMIGVFLRPLRVPASALKKKSVLPDIEAAAA